VDFNQLMAKLGRAGQVQAAAGLLAFIFSFFAWVTADIPAEVKALAEAEGVSTSHNAWQEGAGFAAWFPCLLLLALGVVAVLGALDIMPKLPTALLGVLVGALSSVIILLRWVTLEDHVNAGWALYVTLVLALAVTGVSYMGLAAEGTSLSQIPQAFQQRGQAGPPAGQGGPEGQGGQWGPPPNQG